MSDTNPAGQTGSTVLTSTTPTTDAGNSGKTEGTPAAEPKQSQSQQEATKTEAQTSKGAGGEGKPESTAAADIEVKLPDGVEADKALLDGFTAWAKERGLKSDDAQKVADLYVQAQQAAQQKAQVQHEQQQAGWVEGLKADKEIGGANWEASRKHAQRALAKFGSKELSAYFDSSGLGNHPELVRMVVRIGKAMGEDTIAGSTSTPVRENSDEARLRRQYPTMFKE